MTASSNTSQSTFGNIIVAVMVGVVAVGSIVVSATGLGTAKVEIVAAARDSAGSLTVAGRVLRGGAPVARAHVWAVAADRRGNRYSPAADTCGPDGGFALGPMPTRFGPENSAIVSDITLFAASPDSAASTRPIGREELRVGPAKEARWVQIRPFALLSILVIFVLSVGLALAPERVPAAARYYGSVFLAFLFTVVMVAYISAGLRFVNVSGGPGEVITLGFANLHRGTYVADVAEEWLFSLTAPAVTQQGTDTGFGAPLWVLLVSVVGAGVFTVSIIVRYTQEPIDFTDPGKVRQRVQEIVRHQFYILFAPLSGVIVYQLIVAAGAASQQVTVALATLGAAVGLRQVLDKAQKSVDKWLGVTDTG
ncbi:MAG: hypothetical protein ACREN5_03535 [Gemmatimonadales bacterium]